MTEQTLPKPIVKKLMFVKKFAQKGEDRTLMIEWSDDEDEEATPQKGQTGIQTYDLAKDTLPFFISLSVSYSC